MRTYSSKRWSVLSFLALVGLAASSCANGVDDGDPNASVATTTVPPLGTAPSGGAGGTGASGSTTVAAQEQAATYSAQEASSIVAAIRAGEGRRAELARERSSSSLVQGYASRLAQTASFTSAPSDPLAASIARQDRVSVAALSEVDSAQFDTEYISSEISLSARTVALVDHSLAPSVVADPNAQDANRNDLSSLRASAVARLMDALDTQRTLRGGADARSPERLF